MKNYLLAASLWLTAASGLSAQGPSLTPAQLRSYNASLFGQVYRLSPAQVADLHRTTGVPAQRALATKRLLDALLTQSPVDTFHGNPPTQRLAPGHYALVEATGEELSLELLEISELQVFLLNDLRDFVLQVTDLNGQVLPDATVLLRGKKAAFDAATRTFKIKKHYRGGLLEVYHGDRALFREVEGLSKREYHQRKRYARRSHGLGKVVYAPVRQLNRTVFWVKAKVQHNGRYYRYNPRAQRYQQRHTLKGYVALSQPRYRPDDTLRVSAYLTDGRGRPLRHALDLSVHSWGTSKTIERRVSPREPGVFVFETPLRDSLQLDKAYEVTFTDNRHNRFDFEPEMSGDFRYEDYQLDVVNYQLRPLQTQFTVGQPIRLALSARDANEQPVPEIRATVVLKTTSVGDFRTDDLWVPDTLWRHTFDLEPRRETTLAVPDSIFPPHCNLRVEVNAWFVNAAGEQQVKSIAFDRNQPEVAERLSADIDHNLLIVKHLNPKNTSGNEALLTTVWANGLRTERRIRLPFQDTVAPSVRRYEVQLGSLYASAAPDAEQVEIEGARLLDTVVFVVKNPLALPFRYVVNSNRAEQVEEGTASDTLWRWVRTDPQHRDFHLKVEYVWGATAQQASETVYYYANLLSLDLEQPARVLPGETAQVRVKVRDAEQRPAAGVHLVAGAFNKQFGAAEPYTAPEITYGKGRWRGRRTNFTLEGEALQWQNRVTLTAPWFERLALDSLAYYRLHFRPAGNGGGWAERWNLPPDSTVGNRPQVAPWVVSRGRAEPVYLLWVNRELVYYSGAAARPYSFWAEKGWNQVQIRTRTHEYTVDSLWLEKGQKVEFALDSTAVLRQKRIALPGQPVGLRVSVASRPDSLTAYEQQWLRKSIFYWRSDQSAGGLDYFWQSAYSVHSISRGVGQNAALGPFTSGRDLTFYRPGEFLRTLEFEPGFLYDITPRRERLYALPPRAGWVNRLTGRSGALLLPGQKALTRSDIRVPKPPQQRLVLDWRSPAPDRSGAGTLLWNVPPGVDTTFAGVALLNLKQDSLCYGPYLPTHRRLNGLAAGRYRFLFFKHDGQVAFETVEIRRDSLHFVQWSAPLWQDSLQKTPPLGSTFSDFLKMLSGKGQSEVTKVSSAPSSFSQWPGAEANCTVSGVVRDQGNEEELIGASIAFYQDGVLVRGTVTDVLGRFNIRLAPGVYDLQVSYTGYTTQKLAGVMASWGIPQVLEVDLAPSSHLDEVVVTAYKIPLVSADRTMSGKTLTSEEIRRLPTRSVSALQGKLAGVDIENLPVYYGELDGDVTGGVISIKGNRAPGTVYYLDGVRIEGHGWTGDTTLPDGPVALRKDFRDYAYWQPHLLTDRKGEAYFQVKFPDDQTAWSSFVVGMDRRKRSGVGRATTVAFKPLSAQLSLPRFAVAGDRFRANGLITNLDSDSALVRSTFRQDGRVLAEQTRRIGPALSEFAEVVAPVGADSLHVSYEMQAANSSDGEARGIAIMPVGTRETTGHFWFLEHDTTVVFTPNNNNGGAVTLRVENSALDLLLHDIQYLATYPYGCNEQTASRLTALLLLERLLPRLTPEQFKQQPGLARYRDPQVLKTDIRDCAARLRKTQLPDGSWGWWADGAVNAWMTVYVTRALQQAKAAGYTTEAFDRGLGWLRNSFARLPFNDQQAALAVLRTAGVNVDCTPVLTRLDTTPNSLYERLGQWRLYQLCGRQVPRDSLLSYLKPSLFGGLYCGEQSTNWYNRQATNTLLVYDLAEAAGYTDLTARIRRFWVENRTEQPSNTFEAAQILWRFVAADSTALFKQGTGNNLIVNGQQAIATFPAQQILPAGATSVTLQKTGNAPLFVTAYQQWHNPAPTPRDDVFGVKTALQQNGKPLANGAALQRGLAAELHVTVEVKARAEYVMLEVPIPAGCSYGEKEQASQWRWWRTPGEVHREYFRDRVAIFCETLPVGKYEFKVALEPRFDGTFTLNPARAEQMYFPTFFGRNGVGVVEVVR